MAYSAMPGIRPDNEDAEYSSYFEWLDGDSKRIDVYDRTPDGGKLITPFGSGRPIKPDHLPTKVNRVDPNKPRTPLLDVERLGSLFFVCQIFKDIVDEFEPDTHQFFPIELFELGEKVADYYLFNICTRLDTIHPELTFPRNARGFYKPVADEPSALVLSVDAIGDHHIWIDKFLHTAKMSNGIAARFSEAGLTGLRLNGPIEQA